MAFQLPTVKRRRERGNGAGGAKDRRSRFRLSTPGFTAIARRVRRILEKTNPERPVTLTIEETELLSAFEALPRVRGGGSLVSDAHRRVLEAYEDVRGRDRTGLVRALRR